MNFWQGRKITIRAVEPDDYKLFFAILKDAGIQKNEADIRVPMSLEACKSWTLKESQKGNDNDSPFLIIEDNDNNIVGIATPNRMDSRVGIFSCGINILPEHQRKGYAYEALQLI